VESPGKLTRKASKERLTKGFVVEECRLNVPRQWRQNVIVEFVGKV
jgi:hypothetical protein